MTDGQWGGDYQKQNKNVCPFQLSTQFQAATRMRPKRCYSSGLQLSILLPNRGHCIPLKHVPHVTKMKSQVRRSELSPAAIFLFPMRTSASGHNVQ